MRWQKSDGAVVRRKGKEMTIEDVRDSWEQISDFTEPSYPASIGESNARIYQVLQEIDEQPITRRRLTKNNLSAIEPVGFEGKLENSVYRVLDLSERICEKKTTHCFTLPFCLQDKAIGKQLTGNDFTYEAKDVILYALGGHNWFSFPLPTESTLCTLFARRKNYFVNSQFSVANHHSHVSICGRVTLW